MQFEDIGRQVLATGHRKQPRHYIDKISECRSLSRVVQGWIQRGVFFLGGGGQVKWRLGRTKCVWGGLFFLKGHTVGRDGLFSCNAIDMMLKLSYVWGEPNDGFRVFGRVNVLLPLDPPLGWYSIDESALESSV